MFVLNDDLSIYATRGDIVFFTVSAEENGEAHMFKAGDVVRIKIYGKKDANNVVLEKDFPVVEDTTAVEIFLTGEDTKIGGVISKPVVYWYEVELNPRTNPQTIIGYDDDGAKEFRLFPEGKDLIDYVPDSEDIPFVDAELDLLSPRPLQNQAIARAIVQLTGNIKDVEKDIGGALGQTNENVVSLRREIATERNRINTLTALPAGSTTNDARLEDICNGEDGIVYGSPANAVRGQIKGADENMLGEIAFLRDKEIAISPTLYDGFAKYETGIISDDSFDGYYKRTGYLYIPSNCERIEHNFVANSTGVDGVAFFDFAKNYISGYKHNGTITDIPAGARYVVLSNYDNARTHSGKSVVMHAPAPVVVDSGIGALVTYGDSHVARALWQQKVIEGLNVAKHTNLGIGGSTVAVNAAATVLPFVADERIAAIKNENPDTLIIIGGTNDVHLETPLGTVGELANKEKNKETFYGAYGYLLETLLAWKPSLKIVLCTTPQGFYDNIHPVKYSEISRAIKEIAYHYSLPVADIFGECGINKINLATYSDDLIHYNESGNERVASLILKTIKRSYLGKE